MLDSRIVDQNINPAEPITRELRKLVHLMGSPQIGEAVDGIDAPGLSYFVREALALSARSTAVQDQVTAASARARAIPSPMPLEDPVTYSGATGERSKDCTWGD
jgi:hypothetical protein